MSKIYISLIIVSVFFIGIVSLPVLIKAAFSDPIDLTTSDTTASDASISIDSGGVIHTVWAEDVSGVGEIIYAKSTDDGATFPGANRINVSSNPSFSSANPWLEVDGSDVIHVVWEEDTESGESEVYYAKSTDGGVSFSAPKNLSNNATHSISPYIETSAGNKIHVTWTDVVISPEELNQVFYANSTDGGNNFSSPVNISNASHELDNSVIRASGNFIIVLWSAEGPENGIYRVISTDNGVSFGSALNLSGDTVTRVYNPVVGIDGDGRIHVAAEAFVSGSKEVYYWRSLDSGVSFESTVNLSNTSDAVSELPTLLAVGSKTVHVVWAEDVCDVGQCVKRVYRIKSNNGGGSFSNPSAPGPLQVFVGVKESDVDVYGLNAYIVWQENGVVRFTKGK